MYRRVWEVGRYHNHSLSDWVPTALSEPHHNIMSARATRPRSTPVVSRWINGSCDCLDVLHWSASTTILQASGLEHPTVLHLHLSRLILLAPVSDLQKLARARLRQKARNDTDTYLFPTVRDDICPNYLLDWVVHDQSKARLTMIHAGSVFWFLRRYSCGAVIEPFANYIATLVIWAYNWAITAVKLLKKPQSSSATYQSHRVNDARLPKRNGASYQDCNSIIHPQQSTAENDSSLSYYDPPSLGTHVAGTLEQLGGLETYFIQLDRPCDDELVQLFVRFGDQMTPYMARIGDIEREDSAGKILQEGIRLLSDHGNHATDTVAGESDGSPTFIWGATEGFISILSALATTVGY